MQSGNYEIDKLIDRLRSAVESDRNQRLLNIKSPRCVFNTEEPIIWAEIFRYDANRYYTDPVFYFEQFLRQKLWRWEMFPDDEQPVSLEIPAWLGWYSEYTYAGLNVRFDRKGVPVLQEDHPLTKSPDLKLLNPVDFHKSGWMPRALKWYDDLQKIASGGIKVVFEMNWWRGGLDLAIQLRGYENFVLDTIERPQFIHDLMKWLTEQRIRWHQGFYRHFGYNLDGKAGIGPTSIGDDWINVPFVSPEIFRDFILPCYLEIEEFHKAVTWVHSCGNQVPVQKYLLEIKSLPGLEIGPWSDMKQSLLNIPKDKSLVIGLRPTDVLEASPGQMENHLRKITDACRGRMYDIGTSGLSPLSSDIDDFIERIRTWNSVVKKVVLPERV
jgi:hypothetical protein